MVQFKHYGRHDWSNGGLGHHIFEHVANCASCTTVAITTASVAVVVAAVVVATFATVAATVTAVLAIVTTVVIAITVAAITVMLQELLQQLLLHFQTVDGCSSCNSCCHGTCYCNSCTFIISF